jgi:alkylation response protein AidB-like acyl-CoA dehydrogenase
VTVDASDSILPKVEGLKGPFGCLNSARFGISFGAIGALEECVKLAKEYALERSGPISFVFSNFFFCQLWMDDAEIRNGIHWL